MVSRKYIPRPSDLVWTKNMIETMNDGGVWGLPINGQVYKFDKVNKELNLIEGKMDDMFDKVVVNFGYFGYKVGDNRSKSTG